MPATATTQKIQRLAFAWTLSIDPPRGESKSVMILNLVPIALVLMLVLWPILLAVAITGYHAFGDRRSKSREARRALAQYRGVQPVA